jgi:quercetin dioxygenase-like cupin family protein
VFNYKTVKAETVAESGACHVKIRWLISKDIGAPNFAMRLFEVTEGGYSPLHTHPWEHEVFILEGEGVVFDGKKATPFEPNDVVYVPASEWHQFKNTGHSTLKFLCLIPHPRK